MLLKNRSSFAKFRYGVTPLKRETERYEGKEVHERTCFNCSSIIKYEQHYVILKCPLYSNLPAETNIDYLKNKTKHK